MSKMVMRSERKPPLPKSPIRVRPRRVLRSTPTVAQSSPGSLIKTPLMNRSTNTEQKSELRPECHTISLDLRALTKMVQDEFGKPNLGKTDFEYPYGLAPKPLFERGRFYDEYSARRNERLKRKRDGQTSEDCESKNVYDLGVKVESAKKTVAKRSVVSTPMTENRGGTSRYMLRSMNKENKKPPLPVKYESSAIGKSVARRIRKG